MSKRTSNTSAGRKHTHISHENETGIEPQRIDAVDEQNIQAEDIKSEIDLKTEDKSDGSETQDNILVKLGKAEQESREWYDKYLRLSAEFDNYRKRTIKEKADNLKYANEDLLRGMISIVDDFERGLDIIEKSSDIEALKTGVQLIYNKFCEFIKRNGLKEIDARNQEFNIDFHEAVTTIPAPTDEMKGKVIEVVEKGYTLNDKVIRYAKVVLGE